MAKKINTTKVIAGLSITVAGGLLASFLDEAIVTAGTGGVGAVAAPVQAPATMGIGAILITIGLPLTVDGLTGN
jgi:hypothetical protein